MRISPVAAAIAAVAIIGMSAGPARATAAAIEVTTSGPDRDNPTNSPQASGTVTAISGCLVDGITLTLTTPEQHPLPGALSIAGNGESTQSFSWAPSLPENGHFALRVEAVQRQSSPLADCSGTARVEADLWVEAQPASVVITRSTTDSKNRTVTIVFQRNNEADVIGYLVYRAHGSDEALPVYGADQSPPGSKLTFVDDLSEAEGGSYSYSLTALRPSSDWYQSDRRRPPSSSPESTSSRATATMPPQPRPVTTTAPSGGTSGGAAASGSSVRSVGRINFGAFASELNSAKRTTSPTEFDPGFGERLPFKPKTSVERESGEFANAPGSQGEERPMGLLAFATGLLLLVVAGHMLWLRQEVARVPLEALVPEDPVPLPVAEVPPLPLAPEQRRRRKPLTDSHAP